MGDNEQDIFRDFVEDLLTDCLEDDLRKWFKGEEQAILIDLDQNSGLEDEIRQIAESIPEEVCTKVVKMVRKEYDNKTTITLFKDTGEIHMARSMDQIQADIKYMKNTIRQQKLRLKEYEIELEEHF